MGCLLTGSFRGPAGSVQPAGPHHERDLARGAQCVKRVVVKGLRRVERPQWQRQDAQQPPADFVVDDLTDLSRIRGPFDLLVDYGSFDLKPKARAARSQRCGLSPRPNGDATMAPE